MRQTLVSAMGDNVRYPWGDAFLWRCQASGCKFVVDALHPIVKLLTCARIRRGECSDNARFTGGKYEIGARNQEHWRSNNGKYRLSAKL
jgi:hypothetical protein